MAQIVVALCAYLGGMGEMAKAGETVTFDREDMAAVTEVLYRALMKL